MDRPSAESRRAVLCVWEIAVKHGFNPPQAPLELNLVLLKHSLFD